MCKLAVSDGCQPRELYCEAKMYKPQTKKFAEYTPPPAPPSTHTHEVHYRNQHGITVIERCYSEGSARKALAGAVMKFDSNAKMVQVR